ncbi:MAG TPA: extracellular solute-binding protein [Burkholderiales bacterium]|nr:extracellular solute-binding protein [Burkholderiales bacterium]
MGYEPKYPPGFKHFDYVNPNAPKGGTAVLGWPGSFDSFNPFLLKGVRPIAITSLMFETLTTESWDEPFSGYGLLAEDVTLAPDRLSVTFRLNPLARFSDGSPVTADDVKYSFDMLTSKVAHPQFQSYWGDVKQAVVVDARTVRFEFARQNSELHLIVGQLPVFSRKWGGGKSFDKIVIDQPIASGPYLIESYDFGKGITYKRNPNYWGKDLPVRRGMFNFDRIRFNYYQDDTVRLEAFKAGEFDFNYESSAKRWAKDYIGDKVTRGQIKKAQFKHGNAQGMQGFAFNERHSQFQDKRVRQAITLAFDFEWANQNLFYGQYIRSASYYNNSELAAADVPQGDELALLEPFRDKLPPALFTQPWRPPSTDAPQSLRENLRRAKRLLEEAGWRVKDGVLMSDKGERFEFEMLLYDRTFERICAPFARNLEKLGIKMDYRVVDRALYQRRLDRFEFDMAIQSYGVSQSPGNELFTRFSSKAADAEGSDNAMGIKDPIVDALIQKVVVAPDRRALVAATRALDRVLLWGEHVVPNWYISYHRVAYYDKLQFPEKLPLYYDPMSWMLETWWVK